MDGCDVRCDDGEKKGTEISTLNQFVSFPRSETYLASKGYIASHTCSLGDIPVAIAFGGTACITATGDGVQWRTSHVRGGGVMIGVNSPVSDVMGTPRDGKAQWPMGAEPLASDVGRSCSSGFRNSGTLLLPV
jgi:hypothetical protein